MMDRDTMRRWGRWVGTFVGFPLAGVAARTAVGDVDAAGAAVVGGLVGGAVLGAVQATVGGLPTGTRARWVAGTGVGLAAGLGLGAATVGYRTDAASLVAMGALSGALVGLAQAAVLVGSSADRVLWALATPALWAGGWLVTSQVIVDADRHHATFGSSGALLVSLLAGALVARWGRPASAAGAADALAVGVAR